MCTFSSCCNETPVARFKISTEKPLVGQPIKFENSSTFGRGTAQWNFGDNSEINKNPMPHVEHTFREPGNYEVVLKVQSGRSSATVKHIISIKNK